MINLKILLLIFIFSYISYAKRFLKRLVEEVKGRKIKFRNGKSSKILDLQYPDGPIILAQVENEYGSYGSNVDYMNSLASAVKEYGMNKSVLYTTDGPWMVKKGSTPQAFPTVDFGVSNEMQVTSYFQKQQEVSKCGRFL